MVGKLLLRGMIAGLIAAVLAFIFARFFGEPPIDQAIAFEEMLAEAAGEPDEPEIVSRNVQAGIGLAVALGAFGIAAGGLFALVFAWIEGRVSRLGVRTTSALLALAAFVSITLVPQLKYAPNPPAVGSEDSINERTLLFFVMVAISITALVIGIMVARRIAAGSGFWRGALSGSGVWLVIVVLAAVLLPSINEVPDGFPADVLWQFRIVSLGLHAIFWSVIGIAFGVMAEREMSPRIAFAT